MSKQTISYILFILFMFSPLQLQAKGGDTPAKLTYSFDMNGEMKSEMVVELLIPPEGHFSARAVSRLKFPELMARRLTENPIESPVIVEGERVGDRLFFKITYLSKEFHVLGEYDALGYSPGFSWVLPEMVTNFDILFADGATFNWSEPVSGAHGQWTLRLVESKKLLSITIVSGATQKNVDGPANWAAVRSDAGEVVVEATTQPNTPDAWKEIRWSGDDTTAVTGKPNQRKLRSNTSRRFLIKAELGKISRELELWVIDAHVRILTSGQVPGGSPGFGTRFDRTGNLGAVLYDGGNQAAGKIAAIAKITPKGIHNIIKLGWSFKRELMGVRFEDRTPNPRWSHWTNDTSQPAFQKLVPDVDDQIYDLDAPTIGGAHWFDTNEAYINFRQWIEWNGERCSEFAYWYWMARWEFMKSPKVTLRKVELGSIRIPNQTFYSP